MRRPGGAARCALQLLHCRPPARLPCPLAAVVATVWEKDAVLFTRGLRQGGGPPALAVSTRLPRFQETFTLTITPRWVLCLGSSREGGMCRACGKQAEGAGQLAEHQCQWRRWLRVTGRDSSAVCAASEAAAPRVNAAPPLPLQRRACGERRWSQHVMQHRRVLPQASGGGQLPLRPRTDMSWRDVLGADPCCCCCCAVAPHAHALQLFATSRARSDGYLAKDVVRADTQRLLAQLLEDKSK